MGGPELLDRFRNVAIKRTTKSLMQLSADCARYRGAIHVIIYIWTRGGCEMYTELVEIVI